MKQNKKILPLLLLSTAIVTTAYASSDHEIDETQEARRSVVAGEDDDGETSDTVSTTSSALQPLVFPSVVEESELVKLLSLHIKPVTVKFQTTEMEKTPGKGNRICHVKKNRQFIISPEQVIALLIFDFSTADAEERLKKILRVKRDQKKAGGTPRVTRSAASAYPVSDEQNTSFYLGVWIAMMETLHNLNYKPACAFDAERTSWEERNVALNGRIEHLETVVEESEKSVVTIADLQRQLEEIEKINKAKDNEKEAVTEENTRLAKAFFTEQQRANLAEEKSNTGLEENRRLAQRLAELQRKLTEFKSAAELAAQQAKDERASDAQREAGANLATQQEREEEKKRLQGQLDAAVQRAEVAELGIKQEKAEKIAAERKAEQSVAASAATNQDLKDQLDAEVQRAAAVERMIQQEKTAKEAAVEAVKQLKEESDAVKIAGEEEKQRLQAKLEALVQRAAAAERKAEQRVVELGVNQEKATREAIELAAQQWKEEREVERSEAERERSRLQNELDAAVQAKLAGEEERQRLQGQLDEAERRVAEVTQQANAERDAAELLTQQEREATKAANLATQQEREEEKQRLQGQLDAAVQRAEEAKAATEQRADDAEAATQQAAAALDATIVQLTDQIDAHLATIRARDGIIAQLQADLDAAQQAVAQQAAAAPQNGRFVVNKGALTPLGDD